MIEAARLRARGSPDATKLRDDRRLTAQPDIDRVLRQTPAAGESRGSGSLVVVPDNTSSIRTSVRMEPDANASARRRSGLLDGVLEVAVAVGARRRARRTGPRGRSAAFRRRSSSPRTTPKSRWRQVAWANARGLRDELRQVVARGVQAVDERRVSGHVATCSASAGGRAARPRRQRHPRRDVRVDARRTARRWRRASPAPTTGQARPRVTALPSSSVSS